MTAPPPAGPDQYSVACAIWPAAGTWSTSANSVHSTWPTTAHLTAGVSRMGLTSGSHGWRHRRRSRLRFSRLRSHGCGLGRGSRPLASLESQGAGLTVRVLTLGFL